MTRKIKPILALIAVCSHTLHAEQAAWEAGLGIGTLTSPHYRGSNTSENILLPIPYLQYRGKFLRTEGQGIDGYFIDSENFELTLSAKASSNSTNNKLRQGMPKLDPTFEWGPSLNFNLGNSSSEEGYMLRIPLRAINSFNKNGIHHIGWLLDPNIAYRKSGLFTHWDLRAHTGLMYGDRHYHDYYYSVAPAYALEHRPAFAASRGYSGFNSEISLTRRWGCCWIGAFLRYDNLSGAEFIQSPLLETRHYWVAGIGISWIFAQSEGTPLHD